MTIEECPVTVDDLKKQLRLSLDDTLKDALELNLLAAAEYIEDFCGRKFDTFESGVPAQLKQAILLKAASLFENPTDQLDERTTASQRLANPRKWQQEITK